MDGMGEQRPRSDPKTVGIDGRARVLARRWGVVFILRRRQGENLTTPAASLITDREDPTSPNQKND
jgi:hypothetical protein